MRRNLFNHSGEYQELVSKIRTAHRKSLKVKSFTSYYKYKLPKIFD